MVAYKGKKHVEDWGYFKGGIWIRYTTDPDNIEHVQDIILRNGKANDIGINGVFYYGKDPISIVIDKGEIIREASCHAYLDPKKYPAQAGRPEGVIGWDGERFFYQRAKYASEIIRKHSSVVWAYGGVSMGKMFNPAAEGFTGAFSDPLRRTGHNGMMAKSGKVNLMTFINMNAATINLLTAKLGADISIMFDGGHAVVGTGKRRRTSHGSKTFVSKSAIMLKGV